MSVWYLTGGRYTEWGPDVVAAIQRLTEPLPPEPVDPPTTDPVPDTPDEEPATPELGDET